MRDAPLVEEVPFVFPPEVPRAGVHLSDILKPLLRAHDPKRYSGKIDDHARANFERGFALEDMLKAKRLWPSHLLLQQEFIDDGIIHTLDGFDPFAEITYESKCTLLSSNTHILDDRIIGWKWQIRCYMRVSRSQRAFLDVLHLCGDWNPPKTAPPKRWLWHKHPLEEERYWSMVRRQRDRMAKKGELHA